MLGNDLAALYEPREVLSGMLFALTALEHNKKIIAYMRSSEASNTHPRVDYLDVADELKTQ